MLRTNIALLVLAPMLLVGYAGCAGASPDDELNGETDIESTGEAISLMPRLAGTFRNEKAQSGVAVLALKTDLTFHREDAPVCARGVCTSAQVDGTYRYAHRGGERLLVLRNAIGAPVGVYQYMMDESETALSIAPADTEIWQTLYRSESRWCSVKPDCALQDLPKGYSDGQWECREAACNFETWQVGNRLEPIRHLRAEEPIHPTIPM